MKATETRAFDVTNNDGSLRHGFVVEGLFANQKSWAAITLNNQNSTGMLLSYHETPNEAIQAIMDNEDPELVDKDEDETSED